MQPRLSGFDFEIGIDHDRSPRRLSAAEATDLGIFEIVIRS
jgi:hypothetical protein